MLVSGDEILLIGGGQVFIKLPNTFGQTSDMSCQVCCLFFVSLHLLFPFSRLPPPYTIRF